MMHMCNEFYSLAIINMLVNLINKNLPYCC